jgi:hypothetical protein
VPPDAEQNMPIEEPPDIQDKPSIGKIKPSRNASFRNWFFSGKTIRKHEE